MIHALHGNAGLPDDLHDVLNALGHPFHSWHLWRCLAKDPRCATLEGFGSMLNEAASGDARPHILFGYSLGARLALHALTQRPDNWDAAVLMSPHPGLQGEEERTVRLSHDQLWAARFLLDPWDQVLVAWNAQPVLAGASPSTSGQQSLESWRPQVAQAFDGWSLGRQQDLRPLLPSVTCPVLWLTGMNDDKFTSLATAACPLIPRGKIFTVPAAGHRVHQDQPELLINEVQAFLLSFRG